MKTLAQVYATMREEQAGVSAFDAAQALITQVHLHYYWDGEPDPPQHDEKAA